MKKIVIFVFNDDPMCFIHVLLNTLDMDERGHEAKIVIEGAATKLLPELAKKENPLNGLWEKVKNFGFVDGVCKACSSKTGTLKSAESQDLAILDEMSGHPSMAAYRDQGFEIIVF